mgnify:FL=1
MATIRNLHLFASVVKIHLQQHRTNLHLLLLSNNRLYFFRIVTGLQLNTPVEVTPEDTELDHRLHFQLATEHFSHDNEQIKFHFKVPKNDKTKILIKSFLFFSLPVFCRSFNNQQIFHCSNNHYRSWNLYISI